MEEMSKTVTLDTAVLEKWAAAFAAHGIDLSPVKELLSLCEHLSEKGENVSLENSEGTLDVDLIEKFLPFLDHFSKGRIFEMIIDGKIDWHFLRTLLVYFDPHSFVEAAVIAGTLPYEALELAREAMAEQWEREAARENQ